MEPPPVVVTRRLTLGNCRAELEEITKVVQRVFLLPGNDARGLWCSPARSQKMVQLGVCAGGEVLAGQVSGTVCLVDAKPAKSGIKCAICHGECVMG